MNTPGSTMKEDEEQRATRSPSIIDLDQIQTQEDDFTRNLVKLDVNKDGHVDTNELVTFMDEYVTSVQKKKHMRMFAAALTLICAVLAFANFGLTVAAIILANELKTSGGTLVDTDDNLVYTTYAYQKASTFSWGSSVNHWIGLEAFTVTTDAGATKKFVVSAVNASAPTQVVQVVTAGGEVLRVDLAAQTLTDAEGTVVLSEAARRRRRLAERELCTGTCSSASSGAECGANCAASGSSCSCGI
mmetsp:Transcript_24359/g.39421  ORF Transcript_24359/g.39421 Transcript_24359/m.39421 type:complete len:245 (+) Transcript_24359:165-899(+)